jgi:hypothetical protein
MRCEAFALQSRNQVELIALTFILAGGVHDASFGGEHDPVRTIDIELTYWPSLIEFCNSGAPLARARCFQSTGLVDAGRASGWEARSNGRRSVAALRGLIVLQCRRSPHKL